MQMAEQTQGSSTAPARWIRWLAPSLGFMALVLASMAFRYDPSAYFGMLKVLIMHPYPSPFIDAQQIPALVECSRHGVDVFVSAPCDPLHRALAYSPLWLKASFLPTGKAWSNWIGLSLGAAFYASLALLPQPRRPLGALLFILATFSSLPTFAVERGNMDLVMFVLVALGGWCWLRPLAIRLPGYVLIVFAGLLKFYPLVLMLLFLRERMKVFFALCVAALASVAGFVWIYHRELREMARNLPIVPIFGDAFGWPQLPAGLGAALKWLLEHAGLYNAAVTSLPHNLQFALLVFFLAFGATLVLAIKLASTSDFKSAVAAAPPAHRGFLIIGAALICGCFFAGQSVGYRGVHLLFALPGVIALAGVSAPRSARLVFWLTVGAMLFVMWRLTLQGLVAHLSGGTEFPLGGSTPAYLFWIAHELAWWWIVSVLLAILFVFVGQSEPFKFTAATFWRQTRQPA